jgi:hypothetical protein
LEQQNNGGVYYVAPAFHLLAQLNDYFERRTVANNSRRVRPSEIRIPYDRQEHWLSFQRARGGDVYMHSEKGEKVELDERPFPEVLGEQVKLMDNRRRLIEVVQSNLAWFREREMPHRELLTESVGEGGTTLLALLAKTAQLALGATLFVVQERGGRE